mmetsp:Transcript_71693/g.184908  ORF Transcript_71693/g.184908 Transcript_71693/m.184908 type:complete len:229 (-) Transcript_71693:406-1092(-)
MPQVTTSGLRVQTSMPRIGPVWNGVRTGSNTGASSAFNRSWPSSDSWYSCAFEVVTARFSSDGLSARLRTHGFALPLMPSMRMVFVFRKASLGSSLFSNTRMMPSSPPVTKPLENARAQVAERGSPGEHSSTVWNSPLLSKSMRSPFSQHTSILSSLSHAWQRRLGTEAGPTGSVFRPSFICRNLKIPSPMTTAMEESVGLNEHSRMGACCALETLMDAIGRALSHIQ